jgi:hypothetical protein
VTGEGIYGPPAAQGTGRRSDRAVAWEGYAMNRRVREGTAGCEVVTRHVEFWTWDLQ